MSAGVLSPAEEVLIPSAEQPVQREGACLDCGRERVTWPLDVVVPDDQWRQLTGRDDGAGILCLDCMLARAARLPGVKVAKLTFAAKYESRRERRERERAEAKAGKDHGRTVAAHGSGGDVHAGPTCAHGNAEGWCDLCDEDQIKRGPQ